MKSGTEATICSFLVENKVEFVGTSKSGCWAPSVAPASRIDVVTKIEIASQNFNWELRALAPFRADDELSIFMSRVCFSENRHTQTSFHEK